MFLIPFLAFLVDITFHIPLLSIFHVIPLICVLKGAPVVISYALLLQMMFLRVERLCYNNSCACVLGRFIVYLCTTIVTHIKYNVIGNNEHKMNVITKK